MKKPYHIIDRENEEAAAALQRFAHANGQYLLPLVDLVNDARTAIDHLIADTGRCLIETILRLSAEQIAGERTPGKPSGDIRWHGSQEGRVKLADRQLSTFSESAAERLRMPLPSRIS